MVAKPGFHGRGVQVARYHHGTNQTGRACTPAASHPKYRRRPPFRRRNDSITYWRTCLCAFRRVPRNHQHLISIPSLQSSQEYCHNSKDYCKTKNCERKPEGPPLQCITAICPDLLNLWWRR